MSVSDILAIITSLFFILGGITVFMIGMSMMGSNIEKATGKSMRRLMGKATKNRIVGVGTGAAVTALVNSSAATTVMIVGFVNVGLMTLTQATSVIMGANIGTTISAFIMALSSAGGATFSIAALFALVAFIGFVFTLVGKSDKFKQFGLILEGVGLIFIGLHVMSGAVKEMLSNENIKVSVENMFIAIGKGKEVLTWEIMVLFVLGIVLTALMQSSAALTAIIISLASSNLITLQMAMCIILGANVGTCLTSLISSMGANVNAKRAAAVHLLFNVAGCVIFIFPVAFAGRYIAQFLNMLIPVTQWQIAVFHMVFNLFTTILLLPFQNILVKLACILIPDRQTTTEENEETLDIRLLKTPAIAVGQVRKQLLKMGFDAFNNYKSALNMLLTKDLSAKDAFDQTEIKIDEDNRYIFKFLVKLSMQEISEIDEKKVSSFYRVVSDIERIGDYAENMVEYAEKMVDDDVEFSDSAKDEIKEMDIHITNLHDYTMRVFSENNLACIPDVEREEKETDRMEEVMQKSHILRMTDGQCSAEAGSLFLQLAVCMERIGDHLHNIAESVKPYGHGAVSQLDE